MADHRFENPDHAELSALAQADPEAFERLRTQLIEEFIGRARNAVIRRRLEGLQFRLDYLRRRSGNPLGATVKIYEMMWRSFLELRHELLTIRQPVRPASTRKLAPVLDFHPRPRVRSA